MLFVRPRPGQSWWPLVAVAVVLSGALLWQDAHRRHLEADAFESAIPSCMKWGLSESACEKRIEASSRRCFRASYTPGSKSSREAFSADNYPGCVLAGFPEWDRADRADRAAARAHDAQEPRDTP